MTNEDIAEQLIVKALLGSYLEGDGQFAIAAALMRLCDILEDYHWGGGR